MVVLMQEVVDMLSATLWADIPAMAVIPRMMIIPSVEWAEVIQETKQPTTLCDNSAI